MAYCNRGVSKTMPLLGQVPSHESRFRPRCTLSAGVLQCGHANLPDPRRILALAKPETPYLFSVSWGSHVWPWRKVMLQGAWWCWEQPRITQ